MDLVEINYIDGQAAKAVLDLGAYRAGIQYFCDVALRIPMQAALSKDVGLGAAPLLQSAGDDFFRVPQAVYGGTVDPVDAEFERAVKGSDGVFVVLRSPPKLPPRAADRPGPAAHRSNAQVSVAKLAR